ncbi:LysR family transcriptional regulator, partial [Pseudomonas viridiflava]|uniref:LysR family transcriptional regulator n=1 Tax=Pseudomonas viridiflava TaxID=33069 RepID=UPI000F01FFE1
FEERNITAAAQRLHLSQPALSGTIKSLESLLGAQLFERQARGVSVTDAARILYPQARRLVAQTESMTRQFRQDARVAEPRIGIEGEIAGAHIRA